jgi:hypothetical protein
VRQAHIHVEPPDPRQWNPGLTEEMVVVIRKALAKDPAERWASVMEMANAWERAVGELGMASARVPEEKVIQPAPAAPGPAGRVPGWPAHLGAWMRQNAPGSYIAVGILVVAAVLLPISLTMGRVEVTPEGALAPSSVLSPAPVAYTQEAQQTAQARATEEAFHLTREAEWTATAQSIQSIIGRMTRAAEQTAEARASEEAFYQQQTREAERTIQARTATAQFVFRQLTREAEQTAEARATEQAVYLQLTRSAQQTAEAASRATRAAQRTLPRCFVARRRHWEKSPSGMGEIGGIVKDRNGQPFTNAVVRLSIAESAWHTDIPLTADGMYNFCCLNMNPHNRHFVELVGWNVRTLENYEFHLHDPNLARVLVDFFEVDCP